MSAALDTVFAYHERTKHHFNRYAAGPGELDWITQPDPFRRFAGCPLLSLPLLGDEQAGVRYVDLYASDAIPAKPLNVESLAALLELSFGISAWKQYGSNRWALRCNPSSGNLHPTEAYVAVQNCQGIADGIHHYVSVDHTLEQRCSFAERTALLPNGSFLVGLSAIHWREAWKYGERAYRYCQHDAGHAIATVRYAAATLGWHAHVLSDWSDKAVARLLGLDRADDFTGAEHESPDVMLLVTTVPTRDTIDSALLVESTTRWAGQANTLSAHHAHHWPVIDAVSQACTKPQTIHTPWRQPSRPEPLPSPCQASAAQIIKQRRSAQQFDGVTSITAATFFRLLDLTLPRQGIPPWDAITWAPRVHLVLFVHRVEGVSPGVYLLPRCDRFEKTIRDELASDFRWEPVETCPAHLHVFRMVAGDARQAARVLSCHQDIAADGAFSVGMIAEFESHLTQTPWVYRQLFWEAGIIGQVLYLESEAAGVRGTGIGCYFDDEVHKLLGIQGRSLQSLYHFTVGGAVADDRLQTLAGYGHLNRASQT